VCGLFGMMRARNWSRERCDRAAGALVMLGLLAEERGVDAAGLAMRGAVGRAAGSTRRADITRFADVRVNGWRVVKTRGRFSTLDQDAIHSDLRRARVVLGHTRWATQGGDKLVNASPLVIGPIVGCHNGDVAVSSVRELVDDQVRLAGSTDTEVLLAALAATDGTATAVRSVLETVHGRVALSWVDHRHPHGLWLARGALSPLAVAGDGQGGLWWASNPQWLRRVEQHFGLGLSAPRMLREGSLLRVRGRDGDLDVQVSPSFVPLVRLQDRRVAGIAAWRGFTRADRADDEARLRNRLVTPVRTGRWRSDPWPVFGAEAVDDWSMPGEPPVGDPDWDDFDWDVA
jgi:glucosamine--fructose-6-phosphate aminotransferase (isomerizing)